VSASGPADDEAPLATRLGELAALFLRLGATAFGGPAAHIAMMRHEVVERRGWMTDAELLDLLAAANLVPGPNSTELALHIGWRRARWAGLLVAGACFILPATFITAALAWIYVRYGALPVLAGVMFGVKPVIVAIVVQAAIALAPVAARTRLLQVAAIGAALAVLLGADEIVVLVLTGVLVLALGRRGTVAPTARGSPHPGLVLLGPVAGKASLPGILGVFLKVGSVLYGSGYVLVAFLRSELVERRGWLTEGQLLDAVAVGQVTPGPVFTTATFIGWLLDGPAGATAATVGIFLPAFVFVALSGPLVPRLRASPAAGRFLDGVNAASLAIMAAVTLQLGWSALHDVWSIAVMVLSAAILVRWRVNPTWPMLAGAAIGVLRLG
jgi:chromate transporter